MSQTVKLLKIIGTPFASGQDLPKSNEEAAELYRYATKNKIGLLYLESLKERGRLEEFGLKSEYEEEREKHDRQTITLSRIAGVLNSSDANYAIFKSIMPFPARPNDVDIIHFGSDNEYETITEIILQSGYMEVKGSADSSQRMFHDVDNGGYLHPHPPEKDIYDIDLYQKVAASYIVYLDKRKIEKYITEITISGDKVKVLRPEAELVTIIIHSIIPEQLCTLFVYYATLYHFSLMSLGEINRSITVVKENNVTFPVKAHCSLVAELHQQAHGFAPETIKKVLAALGNKTGGSKELLQNKLEMPHRYSWSTIIRTLLEKGKEGEFRRSTVRQGMAMLNPKLSKWVIANIIWRRRRETY